MSFFGEHNVGMHRCASATSAMFLYRLHEALVLADMVTTLASNEATSGVKHGLASTRHFSYGWTASSGYFYGWTASNGHCGWRVKQIILKPRSGDIIVGKGVSPCVKCTKSQAA